MISQSRRRDRLRTQTAWMQSKRVSLVLLRSFHWNNPWSSKLKPASEQVALLSTSLAVKIELLSTKAKLGNGCHVGCVKMPLMWAS